MQIAVQGEFWGDLVRPAARLELFEGRVVAAFLDTEGVLWYAFEMPDQFGVQVIAEDSCFFKGVTPMKRVTMVGLNDPAALHNAIAEAVGEEPKARYWSGQPPWYDDFGQRITNEFIDGRTQSGPWAIMTPESHAKHGIGLSTGQGQRYQKEGNKWRKIEGQE